MKGLLIISSLGGSENAKKKFWNEQWHVNEKKNEKAL